MSDFTYIRAEREQRVAKFLGVTLLGLTDADQRKAIVRAAALLRAHELVTLGGKSLSVRECYWLTYAENL